jgi:hypothetical protein
MARNPTLFVSHAAADKPVVDLIVHLLKHGIGVPSRRIFCTSLEQGVIEGGDSFINAVLDRLSEPDAVVLALISHNFNDSPFCGHEVGATWIAKRKPLLLYVIPPSDYKVLSGVLLDRQAPTLAKRATLEELRERVTSLLSLQPPRSGDWNAAVRDFLDRLGPAAFEIERKRAGLEHDVFVSTPMSNLLHKDYVRIRGLAVKLIDALKERSKQAVPAFSHYCAAITYNSKRKFDPEHVAVEQDLPALCGSQHYILVLDQDVKTSAFFEAGMALAYAKSVDSVLQRRSTYFVRSGVRLPFMMTAVDKKYQSVETYSYKNEDELQSYVNRYPKKFGATRWESWGIERGPA